MFRRRGANYKKNIVKKIEIIYLLCNIIYNYQLGSFDRIFLQINLTNLLVLFLFLNYIINE